MLNFCLLNLFRLLAVASNADSPRIGLRQHNLVVLGRLVARVAHLVFEWIVRERLHQLGLRGLMRIVALRAVGCAEGLALMGLLQSCVFRIVTLDAQLRDRTLQVIFKFLFPARAVLVCYVTSLTTHVEGGVTAAVFRYVQSLRMAGQAEIVILCRTGRGLD